MTEILESLPYDYLKVVLRCLAILALFLVFWKGCPFILNKIIPESLSKHNRALILKTGSYGVVILFLFIILAEFDINLTALLGTAGIIGVAIGFASQTSLSNIICGLFLISEKPFIIGDIVSINGTSGIIHAIDLMSVKVRTFDNKIIRFPNDMIFKTEVTNVTHNPLRRMNLKVGVAYKEDIRKVIAIIKELIEANQYCLDNPEPIVFLDEFGSSSLDIFIGVWLYNEHWLKIKESLLIEIKERFDQENIEIPFPHISLYSGEATEPFPIQNKTTDQPL